MVTSGLQKGGVVVVVVVVVVGISRAVLASQEVMPCNVQGSSLRSSVDVVGVGKGVCHPVVGRRVLEERSCRNQKFFPATFSDVNIR